jgi:hypothetical protein
MRFVCDCDSTCTVTVIGLSVVVLDAL